MTRTVQFLILHIKLKFYYYFSKYFNDEESVGARHGNPYIQSQYMRASYKLIRKRQSLYSLCAFLVTTNLKSEKDLSDVIDYTSAQLDRNILFLNSNQENVIEKLQ